MWNAFKHIFPNIGKEEKKHQRQLSREELLIKSGKGSSMAVRRFHEALDKLAEYDRQQQ